MNPAATFRSIASVAKKEFLHILRDWRVLVLILSLPPAFTLLLGHAFENTVLLLDDDRVGFDYPLVPFSVNCYGRRVNSTISSP